MEMMLGEMGRRNAAHLQSTWLAPGESWAPRRLSLSSETCIFESLGTLSAVILLVECAIPPLPRR